MKSRKPIEMDESQEILTESYFMKNLVQGFESNGLHKTVQREVNFPNQFRNSTGNSLAINSRFESTALVL